MNAAAQIVYIGLGSNLDNPQDQIKRALNTLDDLSDSRLLQHSSLYVSKPLGPSDQPDFVNAVAKLETTQPPLALLDALQAIEQSHRRVRLQHWGPRTLDLDILLFGDQVIKHDRLNVPHAYMHERSFVLQPLAEISPDIEIPGYGKLPDLLKQCDDMGLRRLPK